MAAGAISFSLAVSEEVVAGEWGILFSFSLMVDRVLKPCCGSLGESVATDAGFDLWLCLINS